MSTFSARLLITTLALASLRAVYADCAAGTFTTDGGTTCTPCAAGTFSTGTNAGACSNCQAGTFNNVQGATGCCSCCAGYYSDTDGATSCTSCTTTGNGQYSDPNAASAGACSNTMGMYAPTTSCEMSGRFCPATFDTGPSNEVRRRSKLVARACPLGQEYCGGKCEDITSSLWNCGGCSDGSNLDKVGKDCSQIDNANQSKCQKGLCVVESCDSGFLPSISKQSCVRLASRKPTVRRRDL